MKYTFTLVLLFIVGTSSAQYLLNIDGETPNPFSDKSGNNTVTTQGSPLNTNGAVEFPTGDDYLQIDQFVTFDLDGYWQVSFDMKMTDPSDSVYPIDWRSNSNVGHMHIGYTGGRGLYFSDRNINGVYGSLISNPVPLLADTWVHFDVSREGDSLFIDREGTQVASTYFVDNLSPLSTTTIGYSEDFRYDHDGFMMDNLTLTTNPTSSIYQHESFEFDLFPIPARSSLHYSSIEQVEQIRIYNVLGIMISTQKPRNGSIDVSNLSTGCYFLELSSENRVSVKKFLKD